MADMICPRCHSPLFEGRARSARLLGCGRCGGVWLDSAASRAVLQGEAQELVALGNQATQHATVAVDTRSEDLPCPECGEPLARGMVPNTRIEIDLCARHGTWFDANELRLVALAYAKLPAPAKFEDPYPEERLRPMPGSGKWIWSTGEVRPQDYASDRDRFTEKDFEHLMDALVNFLDPPHRK